MQSSQVNFLLRRCCLYSVFNVFFIAAIANMFSKNLLETLSNPFYFIHRIKNIEYLIFIISFTIVLFLQCEKYIHSISYKSFFMLSFLSKMIFFLTFRIVLDFGFGLIIPYYKNFILFFIINFYSSFLETFDYQCGRKTIKAYKPEGFVILFFKNCLFFIKKSNEMMILPFIFSFFTYYFIRNFYLCCLLRRYNPFYKELFHFLLTYLCTYITNFFFNFCYNAILFTYDFNISNVDNFILNDVKFDELEVHPLYFNKLVNCFEVKETKLKIIKTKSVINYLRRSIFTEIDRIKEILKKFDELFWEVENAKYFYSSPVVISKEFDSSKLLRKQPTHNYINIFLQEVKAFFLKRFYKYILLSSFESLSQMMSFLSEADNQDVIFKLINDVNYDAKKECNKIKEKCNKLEKDLRIFLNAEDI